MRKELLLIGAIMLSFFACKSGNSNAGDNFPDIKEYFAAIAPNISQTEFYNIEEALAVINGESNATTQVFQPDYLDMVWGGNEDTRRMESRVWKMDNGNALVGINFFQYEETPKMKFFEVDNNDMSVKEIAAPLKAKDSIRDYFLFYTLYPDSPRLTVYTYDKETPLGGPFKWNFNWNGSEFEKGLSSENASCNPELANFIGDYQEVNYRSDYYLVHLEIEEDEMNVLYASAQDLLLKADGKMTNIKATPNSLSFDVNLELKWWDGPNKNWDASIILKKEDNGIYTMTTKFKSDPADTPLEYINKKVELFKLAKDNRIFDKPLTANLNKDKVSIANMIKVLGLYYNQPDIIATSLYLFKNQRLSEDEMVTVDEPNRFFSYGWGPMDRAMEAKYWKMNDGRYLLIVSNHSQTYDYKPEDQAFVFDYENGTIENIESPLSSRWHWFDAYELGVIYQVRYETDKLVALIPGQDDEIDVVYLTFDGEKFD